MSGIKGASTPPSPVLAQNQASTGSESSGGRAVFDIYNVENPATPEEVGLNKVSDEQKPMADHGNPWVEDLEWYRHPATQALYPFMSPETREQLVQAYHRNDEQAVAAVDVDLEQAMLQVSMNERNRPSTPFFQLSQQQVQNAAAAIMDVLNQHIENATPATKASPQNRTLDIEL